ILLEQLHHALDWRTLHDVLVHTLLRLDRHAALPQERLTEAWRMLTAQHGPVPVHQVARQLGWTRQHLRTQFLREFGLPPKRLSAIARFEHARSLLTSAPRTDLANIAARAGHTDQAHLTRAWHAFTGRSPTGWIAAEFPFVQGTDMATARA